MQMKQQNFLSKKFRQYLRRIREALKVMNQQKASMLDPPFLILSRKDSKKRESHLVQMRSRDTDPLLVRKFFVGVPKTIGHYRWFRISTTSLQFQLEATKGFKRKEVRRVVLQITLIDLHIFP